MSKWNIFGTTRNVWKIGNWRPEISIKQLITHQGNSNYFPLFWLIIKIIAENDLLRKSSRKGQLTHYSKQPRGQAPALSQRDIDFLRGALFVCPVKKLAVIRFGNYHLFMRISRYYPFLTYLLFLLVILKDAVLVFQWEIHWSTAQRISPSYINFSFLFLVNYLLSILNHSFQYASLAIRGIVSNYLFSEWLTPFSYMESSSISFMDHMFLIFPISLESAFPSIHLSTPYSFFLLRLSLFFVWTYGYYPLQTVGIPFAKFPETQLFIRCSELWSFFE